MLAHPLRHLTSLAQLVGRPDRFFTNHLFKRFLRVFPDQVNLEKDL